MRLLSPGQVTTIAYVSSSRSNDTIVLYGISQLLMDIVYVKKCVCRPGFRISYTEELSKELIIAMRQCFKPFYQFAGCFGNFSSFQTALSLERLSYIT